MLVTILIHLTITGIIGLKLVFGGCNRNYGPVGSPECVLLEPYYSKYQWGTCLTNKYIQAVSKGNAICRDKTATYCYYQCMMELYEVAQGNVSSDCACGVDAPKQTPPPPTNQTQLPSHCYSPSGEDCNWYSDCLERRFPCQETSYAINFGLKFCNLYQEHYKSFSTQGQQWIDAVRKCLQVSLAPLLRPFVTATCDQIKKRAFNSHSECYTNPTKNAPSFCDLSFTDTWRIYYTVIPGLMSSCILCDDTFSSAVQFMDVLRTCWEKQTIFTIKKIVVMRIIFRISRALILKRFRRSLQPMDNYSAGANLIKAIANEMEWKSKGVSWVAYFEKNITDDKPMNHSRHYLNILLAPSKLYNLNDRRNTSLDTNMTTIVNDITQAFRNGRLSSDMITGISLEKYLVCTDYSCSNTTVELTVSASKKGTENKVLSLTTILLIAAGLFLLMIFVSVIICMKRRKSNTIV